MPRKTRHKTTALLAVNPFASYFNVRTRPVEVIAGREVIIQVTPTLHRATDQFKAMDAGSRKCLLPDEQKAISWL